MFQRNGHLLYKRFAGYFFPTVTMALALSLSIAVDGVIVGNMLGSDALAAVNLALPLSLFFSLISSFFGLGGTILAAMELGRKQTDDANETFSVSLVGLAVCGLVAGVLLLVWSDSLAALLSGGDQTLESLVREYLGLLIFGVPFLVFTPGCVYFIRMDGQPGLSAAVLVAANVVNLVADIIFIRLLNSVGGASLATALGYALGTLLLLYYAYAPSRMFRLVWRAESFFSRLAAIARAGFPAALDICVLFIKVICINSLVLSLAGASGMAAFSVCLSCLSLASTFMAGSADTMMPITGVLYGEGDSGGMRLVFRRALGILLAASIGLTVLFELFPGELLAAFGVTDAAGRAVGVPAIRLFALSFVGTGFAYIMMAYYQTVGRPALASIITLVNGLLVVVPAAWILSRPWGLTGVWLSFLLAEVVTLFVILYLVRREEKRTGGDVKGLLLLPPDGKDDGTLDVTIRNTLEEAVGLSERIREFCQSRGVDESTTLKVALAVEEMAVNVVRYGHDIPGKHYMDVGMRLTPESIRVSFRDDGRPFNPLEYSLPSRDSEQESGKDEEPTVGGLRVLKALAVGMSYTYTLNFNSTLISVPRCQGAK